MRRKTAGKLILRKWRCFNNGKDDPDDEQRLILKDFFRVGKHPCYASVWDKKYGQLKFVLMQEYHPDGAQILEWYIESLENKYDSMPELEMRILLIDQAKTLLANNLGYHEKNRAFI